MAARWVQLGVWSPVLRLHSTSSPFNSREPWRYNPETHQVFAESLRFRHRLLPYLYSISVQASHQSRSIIEPMYYDYPERNEAYRFRNQFRFGDQLLVSPITSPRERSTGMGKAVTWLPPGRYIDIFTGMIYDGDRVISLHRPLDKCPVLASEGSIIPLDGAEVLKNGCPLPETVEVWVVVGKDGKFEMVEDDGTGSEVKQIGFRRTLISYDQSTGVITIQSPNSKPLVDIREWSIRLIGYHSENKITAQRNGRNLPIKVILTSNDTMVQLGSVPCTETIMVNLNDQSPQLSIIDTKVVIFGFLDTCEIKLVEKNAIWGIMESKSSTNVRIGELGALKLDETVYAALLEILLADSRQEGSFVLV